MLAPPSALPGISPTRGEIGCCSVSPLLNVSVSAILLIEEGRPVAPPADLPPCGGDARQGGGG
ncbi:hypothetical protein EDE05_12128 [Neorhizobium sp. R1-B]|nr:hypothetical protein EDE09_116105 [Neorhizobium sp. S3-V5DH]TDX74594.1 hypothetical protein EDE05_12128 [Neorhizobium sp. R1-B]